MSQTIVEVIKNRIIGHYDRLLKFPISEEIAAELNLSQRTMRRQLRASGSSYRQVTDNVRFDMAMALITSSTSIPDIADTLGYSDVGGFNQAFKRWAGLTPAQYLVQLQNDVSNS